MPCTGARYVLMNAEQSLPQVAVAGTGWEVRSGLMFNVGPALTQTLKRTRDIITINDAYPLTPTIGTELSFKTNYICQTTAYDVDVSKDSEGTTLDPAFSLETFEKQDIEVAVGGATELLPLNNFGATWTKFNFLQFDATKTKSPTPTINLFVKLQTAQHYGLLMFYYKPIDKDHAAYLTLEADTSPLVIFNNIVSGNEAWWDDKVIAGAHAKYILQEGINIVKIPVSHTLTINKADDVGQTKYGYDDTIIFGNLDIVDGTNDQGLNISLLDYQGTAIDLLAKINTIDTDHIFYYNNVLDNNNVIDLNVAAGQKLSSSLSWYDYNNANNKFVISEIDADYLEEGITIARTSKL